MTRRLDIQAGGFAPDKPITSLGDIMSSTYGFLASLNGISPVNALVSVGLPALASECRGAAVARKLDDSRRVFVGTQTKLYEASGTSYTDVSKGGGTYTGGGENLWRFAQFGNDTIATNRVDPVQVSSSGAFADLGGTPPKASLVDTCNGFVMLADYNDGSNDYPDGWWCSAVRNDASWAASIATQAANGRLLDSPGPIRALRKLGNLMVAYKERSIYLGFYDGPPVIWRWQLLPGEIGAVSQEAVIDIGTAHIFCGFDGFYYFDGSRPVPIDADIHTWFNNTVPAQYRYRIKSTHDRAQKNIIFYLPDSTGALTYAVAYNYFRQKWGFLPVTAVKTSVEYLAAGVTYDSLGTYYSTYNDLPSVTYDSPFWTSGATTPAVVGTDGILKTYPGTPTDSSFDCCYSGDPMQYGTLTRIVPIFSMNATSSMTVTVNRTDNLGDTPVASGPYTYTNGKVDVDKSARYFAPSFHPVGDYEFLGYTMYSEDDGTA